MLEVGLSLPDQGKVSTSAPGLPRRAFGFRAERGKLRPRVRAHEDELVEDARLKLDRRPELARFVARVLRVTRWEGMGPRIPF